MNKEVLEQSLKLSVYDYLNYCRRRKRIRAVGIITDKQFVFYSQVVHGDFYTHNDLVIELENKIHPDNIIKGWDGYRPNDVFLASSGREMIIDAPYNDQLSNSQKDFIIQVLKEIDKFNQEVDDEEKKIRISFCDKTKEKSCYDAIEIDPIIEKLNLKVTKEVSISKEQIIGKTLPEDQVRKNLIERINFDDCKNNDEIKERLENYKQYYDDDFYHEMFIEIVPNFKNIYGFNDNDTDSEIKRVG